MVIENIEVGSGIANIEHLRFSSEDRAQNAGKGHARIVVEGILSTLTTRRLEDWNARYRSREEIQSEPAPLLVRAAESLAPGRALDLACGAGRNALWLASRGWQVVAIDGASEAIRILQESTGTFPVDGRVIDLEDGAALPFDDESFDLVAILFYLHRPLFAEARRVVKRGGVIVAAALMSGTFRIAPGELARTFSDFEIVHASEGEIAEIVARRPGECASVSDRRRPAG